MSKRVDRFIRRYNEFFFDFPEESALIFEIAKKNCLSFTVEFFLKSENESTIGEGRFDL